MRVLKKVPRAKLWLLKFTQQGADNLHKSAKKLGVDPSRSVCLSVCFVWLCLRL